ncbi:MAG TPA: hypothetical protein VFQ68_20120 [Streptosporangiaceae bacterium]|nr:hypothetical protein [Streptosporangiaceae bacterium]
MTTVMRRRMPGMTGQAGSMARQLAGAGVLAGLLGGLAMIAVMILVMGAAGMGYATPLNVGMASFAFTIAPPASMLPTLMPLMGVHLPASVAPQVMAAAGSGHISPALMSRLQAMLMGMHLPAATVTQVGALMNGHAINAQVASLMSMLSPSSQAMVMSAMPVSAAHVVAGAVLHLAYRVPRRGLRDGHRRRDDDAGPAHAYRGRRGNRRGDRRRRGVRRHAVGLLPSVNPLMGLVPQTAFFLAHLLFGLVAGVVLAVMFRRRGMTGAPAPAGQGSARTPTWPCTRRTSPSATSSEPGVRAPTTGRSPP